MHPTKLAPMVMKYKNMKRTSKILTIGFSNALRTISSCLGVFCII